MLRINGATDRGLAREVNEDRFAGEVFDRMLGYAVVCDGMGGTAGGGIASGIACEEVRRMVESSLRPRMEERSIRLLLEGAIENANWAIYDRATRAGDEYRGMGTTLCLALVSGEEAVIANVGDSRCYLLRGDELTQITCDHTVTQQLVDQGAITRQEAMQSPDRHMLTRAVGVEREVMPDWYDIPLRQGDALLLCSDGLYNMIPPQELSVALQQSIASDDPHILIELANAAGGADNITAVVIHNR